MRAALVAVIAFALLFSGNAAEALRYPAAPRCQIFPKSNPWNQRVDRLPVASNSDAIIRSIGLDETLHADFGSGDRKSTRLNSSHVAISYAVFCLKKKNVI